MAKRLVCIGFVFLCLGFVGCAVDTAQQRPQAISNKTKVQIKQEKKAKAAEKAKAKVAAKAKAKREAVAKAKTKREATAKTKREAAKAKREQKARAAAELKSKREAAAKAKREAAARAKAKREEKARFAKLDAEARKQAKAEITQAKHERKRKLAALDTRAKKQAKKEAKKLAEDAKAEQASLKRKFDQDKAKITAEHKRAKAKFTKEQKKRLDAEYKRTVAQLKGEYKEALAKLKEKAKTQTKQIAQAKSQKKAELTESDAKAKKEAKKLAKEIKAKQTSLKRKFDRDKAKAATEYKQAKAAAVKRKAKKEEKARLDAEYKRTVAQLKGEYKEALAKLKEKAKAQAAQHAQAKSQKKAELAELDAKAKEQAKGIKAEQASLKSTLAQDKRKAKPYGIAKLDAEYKKKHVQLEAEYKEALAKLKAKAKVQITQYEREKKQIEAEYEETVAKITMRLRYRRETAKVAKLKLPEDTSPRLTAKELSISGNTLISTAELLTNMPLVYNASDEPLEKAERDYLYDLRVVYDIILQPGQSHEVPARTIQGLTEYILSVYQDQDYAGIYVYVPAEAIKDGTKLQDELLPIKVLEAAVTEVTVKSYDPEQNEVEKGYLRSSAVQEWSPVKVGQVADQKELDDFVNLLNLNPDRYVSAVVTKGAEPQSLAVRYDIYEADPWHYFAQIDNSGTRDRQWTPRVGVINTNLFGIDDTFAAIYQAPVESDWDDNYSLYGSYDFPLLGPQLRLNLYGGYSQFDISPEVGDIDFIGNGDFYGGILRYNILQTNGWFFDIKGSLEHVRSKVTPSLFPSILGTDIKFWLGGYGVDVHRSDDMSNTSLRFDLFKSLGGESSASEFALARTNAKSIFSIYTASAAHSQYLDPNKVHRFSTSLRWIGSNERLVPAKMTVFGGMYTVRGYDEYEIVADGGILASAQYEFDLVKYEETKEAAKTKPEKKPFVRKLAPLVFFDYGRPKIRHPIATEKGHEELMSVGLGTIVELGDHFSGAVYYGYPLGPTDDTRRGKGRLNAGLMMRW